MSRVLCVDFGSTFTKAVLLDTESHAVTEVTEVTKVTADTEVTKVTADTEVTKVTAVTADADTADADTADTADAVTADTADADTADADIADADMADADMADADMADADIADADIADIADGILLAVASVPTTISTDVLDGYRSIREAVAAAGFPDVDEVLACSSAGGGLRLAVVGYERSVTAEAGHRVGLSAGAKVVHVAAGPMNSAQIAALRATRPDVILLVGGTDGGNADVLLHNGARLASARLRAPVVVAGNIDVQGLVATSLESTGRRFVLTDNVLPQIGVINPDGARAAIRQMFLRHVIGGKGLSKSPEFAAMIRAATPDAMLRGVETLAATTDGDAMTDGDDGGVLVVDIGGATTDVYSVITPEGEDAVLRKEVVAPLWHARTVEGDLGMRWNARGVVEAAATENLLSGSDLQQLHSWATRVEADPAYLPDGDREIDLDLSLARIAALVAVRRHARPSQPGGQARPLAGLAHVIGSGGVLRHCPKAKQDNVLRAVTTDFSGGWKVPSGARTTVDSAYLLFAAGLLADADGYGPEVAARVAARVLGPVAPHLH